MMRAFFLPCMLAVAILAAPPAPAAGPTLETVVGGLVAFAEKQPDGCFTTAMAQVCAKSHLLQGTLIQPHECAAQKMCCSCRISFQQLSSQPPGYGFHADAKCPSTIPPQQVQGELLGMVFRGLSDLYSWLEHHET